jgi:hypothetical protein
MHVNATKQPGPTTVPVHSPGSCGRPGPGPGQPTRTTAKTYRSRSRLIDHRYSPLIPWAERLLYRPHEPGDAQRPAPSTDLVRGAGLAHQAHPITARCRVYIPLSGRSAGRFQAQPGCLQSANPAPLSHFAPGGEGVNAPRKIAARAAWYRQHGNRGIGPDCLQEVTV